MGGEIILILIAFVYVIYKLVSEGPDGSGAAFSKDVLVLCIVLVIVGFLRASGTIIGEIITFVFLLALVVYPVIRYLVMNTDILDRIDNDDNEDEDEDDDEVFDYSDEDDYEVFDPSSGDDEIGEIENGDEE